ncbi:MAG: ribonuclease III domain-containing protein [Candidatus Gastranaerophilales bacterium]|nr:ribonuclease III domain-containing protein [Candidatus Gastranaerophilales bacterium]
MEQQAGILNNPADLSIRSYAHIGDAVYELYVREKVVFLTSKPEKLHKISVSLVNAQFQAILLDKIQDVLTEKEKDIVRRARNLSVTTARRINQALHRQSTAFEAIIGYLYLNDKSRLDEVFNYMDTFILEKLAR